MTTNNTDGAALLPVTIPRELFDFLMGVAEIDGTSFGEMNAKLPGRFWWRALLRTAASATQEDAERGGMDRKRIEDCINAAIGLGENGIFVDVEKATESILASLSTIPATAKRPWCETCGEGVAEVLCQTCAKWWHDNAPAQTMDADMEGVMRSAALTNTKADREDM